MHHFRLLLAVPAIALSPVVLAQAVPPTSVAEMFCVARTIGDMSLAAGYISPDLAYATEKALALNLVAQQNNPGEKPPLGDGIPWQSVMDQPSECLVDYSAVEGEPTAVSITYSLAGAPDAGWTDTLIIRSIDGAWLIDDVVYTDGTSLTTALKDAFPQ